jgi:membrane associated rhomboid family serine protease
LKAGYSTLFMAVDPARSPTVQTLALLAIVFVGQQLVAVFAGGVAVAGLFVLALPLSVNPWTLVTSVYAHAGLGHLLVNAAALLVVGLIVERATTRARFHAFFVTTGALAGSVEVVVSGLVGEPTGVLGASGAIFALAGYVLAANPLSNAAFGFVEPSRRVQLVAFVLLAVAVTLATGAPGVALVAHFTGLLVGLVAGRARLLRA